MATKTHPAGTVARSTRFIGGVLAVAFAVALVMSVGTVVAIAFLATALWAETELNRVEGHVARLSARVEELEGRLASPAP